jgi:hypothetical protein
VHWRSTGQKEDCCLRLAGKYRDPLSNFQAPPARPSRPQPRLDQGRRRTELAWPGFIFSQLPAAHPPAVYKLPSRQRQEFHLPSLPFFSSIHLHSIHQRTLASLISQTSKMSPNDNVKVLGMPVSTPNASIAPRKIPLSSKIQQHRKLRNTQHHQLDPTQRCQLLKDDVFDLLEMATCSFSLFGAAGGLSRRWGKNPEKKILSCHVKAQNRVKAQLLTTIIATALRGGLPEYVSSTIPILTPRSRHVQLDRASTLLTAVPSP